jgi:flavin-binding protein dodecin
LDYPSAAAIIGTAPDGIHAALRNGLARSAETTRGLDWFEVQSVRDHLENRTIARFQATINVEAEAADLFFQLVSSRYELVSLIVTSNRSPEILAGPGELRQRNAALSF